MTQNMKDEWGNRIITDVGPGNSSLNIPADCCSLLFLRQVQVIILSVRQKRHTLPVWKIRIGFMSHLSLLNEKAVLSSSCSIIALCKNILQSVDTDGV